MVPDFSPYLGKYLTKHSRILVYFELLEIQGIEAYPGLLQTSKLEYFATKITDFSRWLFLQISPS